MSPRPNGFRRWIAFLALVWGPRRHPVLKRA